MAVTQALLDRKIALLVDDFHYIPADVQKSIIQALKGPVHKGLSVILLAVPHRAFDPIVVEDELQGRFVHIPIPNWSMDDLLLIPQRGFQALNVTLSATAQRRICEEAFGNPLLVQEVCSNLCGAADIWETTITRTALSPTLLDPTFSAVAASKGFPKYRKLREGPQARKARQPRSLRSGDTADIYECLLLALGRLGPKPRNTYDEIRAALRELLEETQMPAKHEVTAALSHMNKIAQSLEGEPPLEFVRDEDALVITDPFLLFYMKWEREKVAPGAQA